MKRNRRVKVDEVEVRDALVENEIINNKLFDDPTDSFDQFGDNDNDLDDLLRKLDNITDTFREENENPFYYFLNMYSY